MRARRLADALAAEGVHHSSTDNRPDRLCPRPRRSGNRDQQLGAGGLHRPGPVGGKLRAI